MSRQVDRAGLDPGQYFFIRTQPVERRLEHPSVDLAGQIIAPGGGQKRAGQDMAVRRFYPDQEFQPLALAGRRLERGYLLAE